MPVNVLALAGGPTVPRARSRGRSARLDRQPARRSRVRRAEGRRARELLDAGTSDYAVRHIPRDVLHDALDSG